MNELRPITDWLPTTVKEARNRGWEDLDVILFSGDAYVDHPSFGSSVIGRIIEDEGLKIAIVPQPNWRDNLKDFKKFGKPNMFFAVSAGTMDSMVNHYTASKRKRSTDAYTPDGLANFRPDYATVVYTKILKEMYPDVKIKWVKITRAVYADPFCDESYKDYRPQYETGIDGFYNAGIQVTSPNYMRSMNNSLLSGKIIANKILNF